MLFNSFTYIAFLAVVCALYRFLPHRAQNILLLAASYLFYAWWDVRFLSIIVLSSSLSYVCALLIRQHRLSAVERGSAVIGAFCSALLVLLPSTRELVHADDLLSLFGDRLALTNRAWLLSAVILAGVLSAHLLQARVAEMEERGRKRLFVVLGITANLLILGFFKYYNFFIENLTSVVQSAGFSPEHLHLNIVLPIGISFFTFKHIGYLVDVYRSSLEPARSYLSFSLFIAFFPALLAGPIDRAEKLLPQIETKRTISAEQTLRGLHLFIYGLFKKLVIADGVIPTVSYVFSSKGQLTWMDVILGTVLFTVQIYGDFSGYTDMARGSAKFFGIDLMTNFNLPYFSRNAQEFWSRWHISLSTWLRDYLYIPLGGNRSGKAMTIRNLMLTMLLGGLWHGAAWNFILWGGYHGALLSLHRIQQYATGNAARSESPWLRVVSIVSFFILTCYGWMLFRAESLAQIVHFTGILIGDIGNVAVTAVKPRFSAVLGLLVLIPVELIEYLGSQDDKKFFYQRLPMPAWTGLYAAILFTIVLGAITDSAQFVYFNF